MPHSLIQNVLCEKDTTASAIREVILDHILIRQRKNSLFYKTEYSAYIASVLTSLIATCCHAGVNALDYLVALQEHRHEVFAAPEAWLPWTYQARLVPP
jgi:hypothetical protein